MIRLRSQFPALKTLWRSLYVTALGCAVIWATLTPALKLVFPEQITCGMECCLESGECCCLVEFDENYAGQHQDEPAFIQAELTKGCPAHCATSPSSSPSFLVKADRTCGLHFLPTDIHNRPHEQRLTVRLQSILISIAPRAPPSFLLSQTI